MTREKANDFNKSGTKSTNSSLSFLKNKKKNMEDPLRSGVHPHSKELVKRDVWLTDYTVPRFNPNLLTNSLSSRLRRAVPSFMMDNNGVMHKLKRESMRDSVMLSALSKQLSSEMQRQKHDLKTEEYELLKRQERLKKTTEWNKRNREKLLGSSNSHSRSKSSPNVRFPKVSYLGPTIADRHKVVHIRHHSAPLPLDELVVDEDASNRSQQSPTRSLDASLDWYQSQTETTIPSPPKTADTNREHTILDLEEAIEAVRVSQKEHFLERMSTVVSFGKPINRTRTREASPGHDRQSLPLSSFKNSSSSRPRGILKKKKVHLSYSAPGAIQFSRQGTQTPRRDLSEELLGQGVKVDSAKYLKLARPSFKYQWLTREPTEIGGVSVAFKAPPVTPPTPSDKHETLKEAKTKTGTSTIPGKLSKQLSPCAVGLNNNGTSEEKLRGKVLQSGDMVIAKVLPSSLSESIPIVMANELCEYIENDRLEKIDELKPSSQPGSLSTINESILLSECDSINTE